MKDFVSNRRVSILAWTAALWIVWAILALPGDRPWIGVVGTLALLIVSSSAFLLGAAPARPFAAAIPRAAGQTRGRKS